MNWKLLFKKNLGFYDKLKRLHLVHGFLFFIIMICGFFLILPVFEEGFPSLRYAIKHFHYFIGVLILLTILFYLPKMKAHFKLVEKERFNIIFVLVLLLLLIGSGFILGFVAKAVPVLGSIAIVVHDVSFFILVPYTIFHAIVRALSLNKIAKKQPSKHVEK